jgi:hypothetical protein
MPFHHPSILLSHRAFTLETISHEVSRNSVVGNERLERRQRIAFVESARELIQPAL